ncbi:Cdc6/Cdc18 family protein [Candidatus Nanohalococcus occultus]|uniref:Cdc6-related protein, AAA superfamily ATPase n=1 Tax=Candidatus Nanohalococcus occultus TaxID=2978047 RepID=A0ABY8CCV8_9ARCH|nr:Cdc6-related protein, AAA superfamily ATPase [Candidatus Nanohaloarchaeota archaeon SVXNc]
MNSFRNSVIEDARVLTADYLPNEMVARDSERQEIARNLRPMTEDQPPIDMLIYGPPGTGKTSMARYVVEELKSKMFANSAYVNCFSHKSKFEIFYEMLDKKLTVPRDGTSTEKVIQLFREKVRDSPTVIIVDEADQVVDDEVMFELSKLNNTGLIMIANDSNVFGHFDSRVRSRLSGVRKIHFRSYSVDQIVEILKRRREHGLRTDSVSDKQLKAIAKAADGDARVGLNSLRTAAQESEKQGNENITDKIIEQSVEVSKSRTRISSLERLNKHQKTVYEILEENGRMKMGNIYQSYCEQIDDNKSKRTIRRYMNKMEAYEVIDSEGAKKAKRYALAD